MLLSQRYFILLLVVTLCGLMTACENKSYTVALTVNSDGSGTAAGTLSGVRYSSNSVENIYCKLDHSTNLNCFAKDATGNFAQCTSKTTETNHDNMVLAARGLQAGSQLNFAWNSAKVCTTLSVTIGTSYAPTTVIPNQATPIDPDPQPSVVTFRQVYTDILSKKCSTACHNGDPNFNSVGEAYNSLINIPIQRLTKCNGQLRVVPGDPDHSGLMKLLEDYNNCDIRMPSSSGLPQEQIDLIRQWIQDGANL